MLDIIEKPHPGDQIVQVPSTNVQLKSNVFLEFKAQRKKWIYEDHYCNPGPIQYFGFDKNFTTTTLVLQHRLYSELQNKIEEYCNMIKSSCRLGTDASILRAAAFQLKTITKIVRILEEKSFS